MATPGKAQAADGGGSAEGEGSGRAGTEGAQVQRQQRLLKSL